jgi:hypothetical protein
MPRPRIHPAALVSPAVLIAAGCLVVGGTGIATAATGGSLVLGERNTSSRVTTLHSDNGTALSLEAPKGKAPLAVNRPTKIANLNADLLDGRSSSAFVASGTGHRLFLTGTTTFTVPAGVTRMVVEVRGGGGSGGLGQYGPGSGGGDGGFARSSIAVSAGQRFVAIVGAGGVVNDFLGDPGGFSLVRREGTAAFVAKALGGGGGAPVGDCNMTQIGGFGGAFEAPTATGAVGFEGLTGDDGESATDYNCTASYTNGTPSPLIRGAGGYGDQEGGTGPQDYPDVAGRAGYVLVEFFV